MTFASSARRTVRSLVPRSSHASRAADAPESGAAPTAGRGRALRIGALATALLLLGGGSIATASAHKTVTLDVDGELTEISTFSGSVAGVLAAEGVAVGERDLVAPDVTDGLQDGDEIVVRTAHPLVIERNGDQTTVWTTELSADDALLALSARGENVRLLASRSAGTGRADLALRLDLDGPVDVVADGETHELADGSVGLEEVLTSLDITLSDLDRVHVELVGDARERLTVVVQRVVVEEQAALSEVPFESVTEPSAELYEGRSATAVAGIAGERTTVHRVVLVDGAEESRRLLSDDVTRAPVTEVIHEGTKVRPAPKPVAPAPRATSGGSTGAVASTVGGDVWAALAQCESGGNPSIVSSNGLYHGLYQFSVSTWQSVGGAGLPSEASPAEQTLRAQILQARSGWGQWPACSLKLGLR